MAAKKSGLEPNPGFFEQVYQVVARIPRGKVMTYGQIAGCLGGLRTGRTVGFAMRAAPAERSLPCHRVINLKGEMSPGYVFGGAANQQALLESEGVRFTAAGSVDLEKSRWAGDNDFTCALRRKKL